MVPAVLDSFGGDGARHWGLSAGQEGDMGECFVKLIQIGSLEGCVLLISFGFSLRNLFLVKL